MNITEFVKGMDATAKEAFNEAEYKFFKKMLSRELADKRESQKKQSESEQIRYLKIKFPCWTLKGDVFVTPLGKKYSISEAYEKFSGSFNC